MSRECCGPDDDLTEAGRDRTQGRGTKGAESTSATDRAQARHAGAAADADEDEDAADARSSHDPAPWWRDRGLLLPMLSGLFLVLGYGLDWSGLTGPRLDPPRLESSGLGLASTVLLAVGLVAGASTFVPSALRRLIRGRLGVGLLMTIAATGAVLLGHVGEAAALAFLFSIAEALEDRAMDRARHGLRALLSVLPETARLSGPSGDVIVPAAQIAERDILVVLAGERVATDGVVVSGRSSMDTAAITGESIPVDIEPGSAVPAGAINGSGTIQLQATAAGLENSLTTIVRLVEEANGRKGRRARLADRIARPLVPIVLVVAALIVVFGFLTGDPGTWTERALVVLVAASPCALAIAVPVTVISAIGAASRFGVVIKSGEAFEALGTIRTVAFDKTGTLTRNKPAIAAVEASSPDLRHRVVQLAAALEARSTHPLASAMLAEVPSPPRATDVQERPGRGITGIVDGQRVDAGSTRWLPAGDLEKHATAMEQDGMTVIVVRADGIPIGVIGIRDELAPEAADAVSRLGEAGIGTIMLTGDNPRTARALAAQAGIGDVRAEQTPADKAAAVEGLARTSPTAMVGDGINDAPALAAATVGIAMGATGSAAAVESADVAFTGNDLRLIPQALAHARRGRRIMAGNIALALAIIVVLFPLALFGIVGLAGVVLVHEVAEVVVILNGVRAARGRSVLPALS